MLVSLYIHIPFCIKKCNYCSFISFDKSNISENGNYNTIKSQYITCLINEITLYSKIIDSSYKISSIFIGGGTPTLLNNEEIYKIIDAIRKNFNLLEEIEITIEANPKTNIDFNALKQAGINRISIGIQSFNDSELGMLGRVHSSQLGVETIKNAQFFFDNINIDIIYNIPFQTLDTLKFTLNQLLKLNIQHVSAYSLIYEQSTNLYNQLINNEIPAIDEESDYNMYMLICSELEKNGFSQYEVSNFAKKDYKCKHNINYWERGNYIGLGLAAHSLINNKRYNNFSDIKNYFECLENHKLPIENEESLKEEQCLEETIFLGLRSDGVLLKVFNSKQIDLINEIIKLDYGHILGNKLVLNSRGKFICDEIVLKLIMEF